MILWRIAALASASGLMTMGNEYLCIVNGQKFTDVLRRITDIQYLHANPELTSHL
jgi:hypothetical protein